MQSKVIGIALAAIPIFVFVVLSILLGSAKANLKISEKKNKAAEKVNEIRNKIRIDSKYRDNIRKLFERR